MNFFNIRHSQLGHFNKDINIILVPMSLYVNTQLHADLEKQSIPDAISQASYYGTNTNSYISEHMEGIISRTDEISGYTAQQILDLVLNKAHGDTAYTATKLSDPLRIGLPSDIVLFIPWQGVSGTNLGSSSPSKNIIDTLGDLAINVVVTGVKLAVGGLIAVGNFLVHLGEAIVSWGISLVASAIGAATAVVKAAVSVAILVMAQLIKAIEIIQLSILFSLLTVIESSVNNNDLNRLIIFSPNSYSINFNSDNFLISLNFSFPDRYVNLFELNLPFFVYNLEIQGLSNSKDFSISRSSGLLNFWDETSSISPTISTLTVMSNSRSFTNLNTNHKDLNTNLKVANSESRPSLNDFLNTVIENFVAGAGASAIYATAVGATAIGIENPIASLVGFIIINSLYLVLLLLIVYKIISNPDLSNFDKASELLGLALGIIFVPFLMDFYSGSTVIPKIELIAAILGLLSVTLGVFYYITDLYQINDGLSDSLNNFVDKNTVLLDITGIALGAAITLRRRASAFQKAKDRLELSMNIMAFISLILIALSVIYFVKG